MRWPAIFSKRAIPAWAIWSFWGGLELLDWWDRGESVIDKVAAVAPMTEPILEWLTSGTGRLFVLVLGLAAILWAMLRPKALTPSTSSSQATTSPVATFDAEHRQRLIERLAALNTIGPHEAAVSFATMRQRSRAELLRSCFDAAGWRTDFTNVPLEGTPQQAAVVGYIKGVRVEGVNKHLVYAVVEAFGDAGLDAAAPVLKTTQVKPDNPKWAWMQRHLNITVGHDD